MFENYDSNYCEIRVYKEDDVKKAAEDILGVNISEKVTDFESAYLKRYLRYKDGKYYYLYMQASGEQLTIRNIKNNGNTYTFDALSALDSDVADDSEFSKYEATIIDGVIKSARKI